MDFKANAEIARIELKRLKLQRDIKKNAKLAVAALGRFDFLVGVTYASKAASAQAADDALADQADRLRLYGSVKKPVTRRATKRRTSDAPSPPAPPP
jgi:hypothetical protein